MKITWLGHASFLMEDRKGSTIITDPYDPSVGYKLFKGKINLVTISHNHFDHNYTNELNGNPTIIDKVGLFNKFNISIEGIPSFHDHEKGLKRGSNIIYTFKFDNYKICHLGDLGHLLTDDDISKIGEIDILLIPVGGNFTIAANEAKEITKKINPHIVIPMHFKTDKINFPIDGVEKFLIEMKNVKKIDSATIEINDKLDGYNRVYVLQYKH
ncbi:MBL fold metallo-hydrolase [Clostridium sp. DL1XJH146]